MAFSRHGHCRTVLAPIFFAFCLTQPSSAQLIQLSPSLLPDARFKADILVIVSHPDDESAIGAYLAKAVFDDKRRVAVVFATNGSAGGNFIGREQAASLGLVREIEARRALSSFQITNLWFLGLPDTPGYDPLASLENWGHGRAVEQVVRIIRLTQPEVILTWIPLNIAGEHGDHQAAGIIATEAMDTAADIATFPAQVAFPKDRLNINNRFEGLLPWQVKKLYFFSELPDFKPVKAGPIFDPTINSPSKKVPYYRLAAIEQSSHLTQAETGQTATRALVSGLFGRLGDPITFVLGKSLVDTQRDGDIFHGVISGALISHFTLGRTSSIQTGAWAELGGAWAFYRQFWQEHGIENLGTLISPEIELDSPPKLWLPLILHNDTAEDFLATVELNSPTGWREYVGSGTYKVPMHSSFPLQMVVEGPANSGSNTELLSVRVSIPTNENLLYQTLRIRRKSS